MNDHLLAAHLESGILSCPDCRAASLNIIEDKLRCGSCNAAFPLINSVPLLVPSAQITSNIQNLSQQIGLADSASRELLIALGSALAFRLNSGPLAAEFGNVAGRFPDIFETDGAGALQRQPPPFDNAEPSLDHFNPADLSAVAPVFCRQFRPAEIRFRAIRITNNSKFTLASEGPQPWNLSYHLYDSDGNLIEYNGLRSQFPVPLRPGASLTVPVCINLPATLGRYRVVFVLVKEFVRWFDEAPLYTVEIDVNENCWRYPQNYSDRPFDLALDNELTLRMYARLVDRSRVNRVLEVACGLYPVTLRRFVANTQVTALDLCFPELQIASLLFGRHPELAGKFYFLSADALAMPLADETFDLAVICAALHHFPEPVRLLRQVHAKLKQGGRLLVAREPCFVDPSATAYLRDLRGGFNEQQFEVEDFVQAFAESGFRCEDLRVDFGGSLKAVLVK